VGFIEYVVLPLWESWAELVGNHPTHNRSFLSLIKYIVSTRYKLNGFRKKKEMTENAWANLPLKTWHWKHWLDGEANGLLLEPSLWFWAPGLAPPAPRSCNKDDDDLVLVESVGLMWLLLVECVSSGDKWLSCDIKC
uniref:Uncharacterized protein n=1 Tax=Romanomermis culicivorax TaxID=13658 RepID=A0A915IKD8_ROMCU